MLRFEGNEIRALTDFDACYYARNKSIRQTYVQHLSAILLGVQGLPRIPITLRKLDCALVFLCTKVYPCSPCCSCYVCLLRIFHQKSLTMNNEKSSQNVLSAQHQVSTHEVTELRSAIDLRKYLLCENSQIKHYKVCLNKSWHATPAHSAWLLLLYSSRRVGAIFHKPTSDKHTCMIST